MNDLVPDHKQTFKRSDKDKGAREEEKALNVCLQTTTDKFADSIFTTLTNVL